MMAIVFKVLVAAAAALLGACVLRSRVPLALSDRRFVQLLLALQLVPALALFVALYVVAGQDVTSDVPGYYVPVARAVLAGQMPYRDFPLSYGPLFPYVGAALLQLWNSPKIFALFAIALNALALVWWHSAAVACFDRQTARVSSVLYATSGHVLVQALLGTNQAWIAAALAASTLLLVRRRDMASGLVQALALVAVKFLVLLFWPVLWICARHRLRWLCGAVLPIALVFGFLIGTGVDVLVPLREEGDLISSGNLPYLLAPLVERLGASAPRLFDGIALLLLGSAVVWLLVKAWKLPPESRLRWLMPALTLIGVTFMLFSKKSFTGYALFFLYPAMLVLAQSIQRAHWRTAFVLAFNVLLAAEPSAWFYLGGDGRGLGAWLATGHATALYAFVLVDIALIACYAYVAVLSFFRIASQSASA